MASGHPLLEHRGTRAVERMVEFAPATGGLALWARHHDLHPSDTAAAPVSTDGNTLFYNAAFAAIDLPLQAGLIAHAVLHVVLRHPQRCLGLQALLGDVDLRLFNTCADAIVNSTLAHLTWLRLPPGAVMLERLLADALGIHQTAEAALLEWDVERLYRAVDDRGSPRPSARRGRRAGGRAAAGSAAAARAPADRPDDRDGMRADGPRAARTRALASGTALDLIPDAGTRDLPEDAAAQAREWGERLLRAHAGDGAHSMLRTLVADLPRTRIPWEQVLRTQLARSLSPRPALSWSRPSRSYIANQGRGAGGRRMPWEPGANGTRPVPRLALMVDVSGSIDDGLMDRFAREIGSITRRLEADMLLVIGDDRVRRVEHFAPGRADLREIDLTGGGGTDFTPLLEEADRYRPDIGVVLTDLEGPARFKPRWPVIWAVPEACAAATPSFGRKLPMA